LSRCLLWQKIPLRRVHWLHQSWFPLVLLSIVLTNFRQPKIFFLVSPPWWGTCLQDHEFQPVRGIIRKHRRYFQGTFSAQWGLAR
jgi:hypothetical protein